jgi:hypothetical protein
MKELEVVTNAVDTFDIGALVGERKTLSKMAGSCSAADALCLRKIRESKQYLSKTKTWEEFCPKYLGIDRSTADRLIRVLEEFGPESFETMGQLGLTPKQYRLLAPQVQGKALHHAGEAIRLLPENGPQIHAALREIRQRTPPRETPTFCQRLNAIEDRGVAIVEEVEALCQLGPGEEDRKRISEALQRMRTSLTQLALDRRL